MAPGRTAFLFTALALLTVALFTADLLVGSVSVAPADIWAALTGGDCDPAIRDIILRIRLLKAVTALLAGAALAASGLQMQTLFRNPLAGPYVLGISSGAGLGVALFLLGAPLLGVSAHSFVQSLGIAGAAWLGAALVLLVVMAVSRRIKDIMVILILGMMFGSGISSIVEILQYLSSEAALKSFVIWTMGSLGDVTGGNLALMLPVVAAGLVLSVAAIKPLNLLLLGENYARTMGLNVQRTRTLLFLSTVLLAGTVTAFCGPVGFIGLAVPHLAVLVGVQVQGGAAVVFAGGAVPPPGVAADLIDGKLLRVLVDLGEDGGDLLGQGGVDGEGAGGGHQHAPLPHRQGRGIQNGPLALGAGGGALRAPLGHGGRVPAEHALPGAGGVHQHLVKEALEALAQPLGVAGGHHGVWHPQTFHVGEQRLGPGFHNLVGPEQPLPGQQPGNLGGLAPGGGAQIQHLLPGLGVQHRDRRAGRGLLHVEQPGVVGGQAAHPLLPGGEGVAQGGERRGLQGKGQRRLQLGLAALEGVAAQAPAGGLLVALEKGGVLCPQKPLHGL